MKINYGGKPFVITATLKEIIEGYLNSLEDNFEIDLPDFELINIREVIVGGEPISVSEEVKIKCTVTDDV